MSLLLKGNWEILKLNKNSLNLERTLFSGQSFIWNIIENTERLFIGTIKDNIVVLKENEIDKDTIEYKFIDSKQLVNDNNKMTEKQRKDELINYFNLGYHINDHLKQWKQDTEPDMKKKHSLNKQFCETYDKFQGLRLIRQNPLDCLFSFICSQNNNITRISKMVKNLQSKYGSEITEVEGQKYYSFPSLDQLMNCKETELNELGFGYRSKFIVQSAKQVKEKGGETWLMSLREKTHQDAHKELQTLMGVGQKVADCVCLFSLDKFDIVPVDTHVYKISQKHMPTLKKKKLSPAIYQEIREFWKSRFGSQSGWAHTILFANEISHFKKRPLEKPQQIENDNETEVTEKKDDKNEEEEEEEEEEVKETKSKKLKR
ncbi:8-oxoguanine DNA-glycosylase [Tieghemostelium lacteum]|uniref:DNA-(apurinic or apyrimidinic site) lyase n=1 Tax=Tieghemostelium lacteum TaxID=361077 RepID=A0A151Z5V5_TIELA|nr:8-oxoguanine DNA-glycosylase [Tieghemostelium lacteum]|eukprot:KYQ89340.1 8-oxoguanine DNA-glycosylase [Tieghemostelium lacteum]